MPPRELSRRQRSRKSINFRTRSNISPHQGFPLTPNPSDANVPTKPPSPAPLAVPSSPHPGYVPSPPSPPPKCLSPPKKHPMSTHTYPPQKRPAPRQQRPNPPLPRKPSAIPGASLVNAIPSKLASRTPRNWDAAPSPTALVYACS